MSKLLLQLCLVLTLLNLPASSGWTGMVAEESVPCTLSRSESFQLYQCGSPLGEASSDAVPSPMRIRRGLAQLRIPNTAVALSNATMARPSQLPKLDLPVEIRRCGLAVLGARLNSFNSSVGGLLLDLSNMSLRFGGHGEFDGLSPAAPTWLDVSHNRIDIVPVNLFNPLPNLVALDLSWNLIEHLDNNTFCSMAGTLRYLDLRANPMLATYSLPKLRSLEWLDASLSKLLTGSFCRMASLRRVTLHRPVTLLNCFLFDSLPKLAELNFTYEVGAKSICSTMVCDPHPVLKTRVPFNFTLSHVNKLGSIVSTKTNVYLSRNNFFSSKYYQRVCTQNYDDYKHYDNQGIPATLGCLQTEDQAPVCPKSPPNLVCSDPTLTTKTTGEPLTANFGLKMIDISSTRPATTAPPIVTNAESGTETTVSDLELHDSTVLPKPDKLGSVSTTSNRIKDLLRRQKARSIQLENDIERLERLIIIFRSITGAFVILVILMIGLIVSDKCRQARLTRQNFWRQNGRDLIGPEQHPLYQTSAAAASTTAPAETSDAAGAESNDYAPVQHPVYPKLPEVFPNPNYGRYS